jgi:hypothetical protein
MPLGLAIGFLRMCMRARRPLWLYTPHPQYILYYILWGGGGVGAGGGVIINMGLLHWSLQTAFLLPA